MNASGRWPENHRLKCPEKVARHTMADTTSFGEEEASLLLEGNNVRCMDLAGLASCSAGSGLNLDLVAAEERSINVIAMGWSVVIDPFEKIPNG